MSTFKEINPMVSEMRQVQLGRLAKAHEAFRAYNEVRSFFRNAENEVEECEKRVGAFLAEYADFGQYCRLLKESYEQAMELRSYPQFDETTPRIGFNGETLFVESEDKMFHGAIRKERNELQIGDRVWIKGLAPKIYTISEFIPNLPLPYRLDTEGQYWYHADTLIPISIEVPQANNAVSQVIRYTHAFSGRVYKLEAYAWEQDNRVYNRVYVNEVLVSTRDYAMTPNHSVYLTSSESALLAALDTGLNHIWKEVKALPF